MNKHTNANSLISSVEESVVMAMDGTKSSLFPHLPYIMQDLWEIGASPEVVIELVKKHATDHSNLKVLDLGSGKGAVSIKLAKATNCYCHGIDAVEDFINEAKNKARKFNVDKKCFFECADIRVRITDLKDFDIVILGAIGPVLGDYFSTLSKVSNCLKGSGLIIIDDAYIDDEVEYSHPLMEKKSAILKQVSDGGMKLIDEVIINKNEIKESDEHIYNNIKKRCGELIKKHPDKRNLFIDYIKKQEEENEVLENKVICSTMVFGFCR